MMNPQHSQHSRDPGAEAFSRLPGGARYWISELLNWPISESTIQDFIWQAVFLGSITWI